MKSVEKHWDAIFKKTEDEKLGWFEKDFRETVSLLRRIPDGELKRVFIPGVGTSSLARLLLERGLQLIVNDISAEALAKLKKQPGMEGQDIRYICHDIARPLPADTGPVDLWLDRAVLHFLTDDRQVEGYFRNAERVVRPGGYLFLAEFSQKGATRCAGLDVRRYALADFQKRLPGYELITSREHTYYNPSGEERPYIYALFRKGEKL